jgi:cleavage and polyadenylation specificity factor subunit 2
MSLSHGSSRAIFSEFASVPDNVVLLTNIGEEGSLARSLFSMWNDEQREDEKWNMGKLGRNILLEQNISLTVREHILTVKAL